MRLAMPCLRPASIALRIPLLALAAALLASACGEDGPRLSRLPEDAVILAFGDSLTFGTGALGAESYPAQLQGLIKRRVVSAGIPGEVTAQALARLPEALDEHSPRLLLLCIGGNDFLQRSSHAAAAENVREMVKLARSRSIEVLLIGTPEPSLSATPPAFYADIAREFGLRYEGAVIGEVLRDRALKSDPVHPNGQGYRVIAERIAESLRDGGAL
jgi:lysophospholipase L1-like esterase